MTEQINNQIHIHCPNNDNIRPANDEPDGIYLSGDWNLSLKKAQQLIGGTIHFHKRHIERSHMGGRILDAYQSEEPNRVVFMFEYDKSCEGISTSKVGWRRDYKILIN